MDLLSLALVFRFVISWFLFYLFVFFQCLPRLSESLSGVFSVVSAEMDAWAVIRLPWCNFWPIKGRKVMRSLQSDTSHASKHDGYRNSRRSLPSSLWGKLFFRELFVQENMYLSVMVYSCCTCRHFSFRGHASGHPNTTWTTSIQYSPPDCLKCSAVIPRLITSWTWSSSFFTWVFIGATKGETIITMGRLLPVSSSVRVACWYIRLLPKSAGKTPNASCPWVNACKSVYSLAFSAGVAVFSSLIRSLFTFSSVIASTGHCVDWWRHHHRVNDPIKMPEHPSDWTALSNSLSMVNI